MSSELVSKNIINDISNPSNSDSKEISISSDSNNDDSMLIATKIISLFCTSRKKKPESVHSLRIFLYPKLKNNFEFLVHFASLIKLEVIFSKISSIDSLSVCDSLEILNISHNKIKKLNGIENMKNLKELHCGENMIESLEEISNLSQLKIIDFHDNLIIDIKPISYCKKLEIIRGGNNKIQTVGDYLKNIDNLHFVNLSGNYLLCYDEIDAFSHIPNLAHLRLNDPHFGSNPICNLSNYHIYSLYKLEQIQSLDGIKIDEASKQKAQISMYKKTMFYQILYNVFQRIFSCYLSVFICFCQKRSNTKILYIVSQTRCNLFLPEIA